MDARVLRRQHSDEELAAIASSGDAISDSCQRRAESLAGTCRATVDAQRFWFGEPRATTIARLRRQQDASAELAQAARAALGL
jgi:hypothetical protein